ncbi:MAG: BF3164 family lipoprotein [Balneolaceae bacterium]|nr:BF3164 family lipoprotein [Balneolaceae bacterium]
MKKSLIRTRLLPIILTALFTTGGSLTAQPSPQPTEPIALQYEWKLDREVLYNPSKIKYVKGYIVLTNGNPDHQIAILRESDRQYLGGFGRHGRGPSEFLSPYLILSEPDNPLFCVYDLNLRRISCYNVEQTVGDFSRPQPELSVTLDGDFGMPINLEARMDQREFIVTGIFSDETRYVISDSTGKVVQRAGTIPTILRNAPINVQHNAALARVASHPGNGRLVFAYRFMDRISIYSAEGELLHDVNAPDPEAEPGVMLAYTDSGQPYMAQDNETRMSYTNVMADEQHIYALYSGRKRKEGTATYAGHLYVYDWNGKLVSRKRFDTFVESCALTDEPGDLLCVVASSDAEEDFRILKYHVSEGDRRNG